MCFRKGKIKDLDLAGTTGYSKPINIIVQILKFYYQINDF